MKRSQIINLLAVVALFLSFQTSADDIELFAGTPSNTTMLPNVIFVLDNAADFSSSADTSHCPSGSLPSGMANTTGGVQACAIYQVLKSLQTNSDGSARVNVGFVVFNSKNIQDINNANCGGSGAVGGCLMVPLVPITQANKTTLESWILSWHTSGGAGNGYIKATNENTAAAMQESWAYYAGNIGLSGRNYASIVPSENCGRNFVVYVGNAYDKNGTPGDTTNPSPQTNPASSGPGLNNAPGVTSSQTAEIAGTSNTTCGSVTIPGTDPQHVQGGYLADEWARYMYQNWQIRTYTVGFLNTAQCKPNYPALLKNMADVGGGDYYETYDYSTLLTALDTIMSQILPANSAFASVSLPVSVNAQGTYLNQVYIGMFRPDDTFLPRWPGNLKQYRMALDSNNNLQLVDAETPAQPAISSGGSGFINECALSYWTPPNISYPSDPYPTYWGTAFNNNNNTYPLCSGHLASSNTPDGAIVEKGAQGFMLRGDPNASSISRTVYTCQTSSCLSLASFNNSTTSAATGVLSSSLIDWERGLNNYSTNEVTTVASTAMRPSVHGDIVHSRPIALNYGSNTNPQVVVYYGGNDGLLHAINGNRDGGLSIGSAAPGNELWSFVPTEFYGNISRLHDDASSGAIWYSNTPNASATPKPYGMDGPISAFQGTIGGASKTFIYAAMRRGGRALYAFDVTDPTTSPSLKWKLGCASNFTFSSPYSPNTLASPDYDDSGCTSGFTGIGQTWSAPVVTQAGYNSGASPILIMGGGYDICEDADPNQCSSTKGNEIYVIDGDTGTLKATLPTDRAVVGQVFVITDSTGMATFAYAADLGGNVYRISGADANSAISTTDPSNWTITKIASLGCNTTSSCSANRKFMYGPDVVLLATGEYGLLIGSGDREKPISAYTTNNSIQNYFFMIEDEPANPNWLTALSGTCGSSVICLNALYPITTSATPTTSQLANYDGWALQLSDEEQVVTSAITVFGTTTFSTHLPSTATCSSLGTTYVYNVSVTNAAGTGPNGTRSQLVSGGGLPPSPVAGMVTLDNGQTVPFLIGGSPESPLQSTLPTSGSGFSQPKSRVYWYIEQ